MPPLKRKMGFALMTPEKRRQIAQKGNRYLRKQNKIHKFTSETGRQAGLKGALKSTTQ